MSNRTGIIALQCSLVKHGVVRAHKSQEKAKKTGIGGIIDSLVKYREVLAQKSQEKAKYLASSMGTEEEKNFGTAPSCTAAAGFINIGKRVSKVSDFLYSRADINKAIIHMKLLYCAGAVNKKDLDSFIKGVKAYCNKSPDPNIKNAVQSKYLTSINVVPPPNMEGVKIALGELVDINNIHPDALQTLEIVLKLAKSNDPIASNIIKLIFKMKVTQKYGFIDSFKNMLEKLSEPTNSLIDKLAEYGGITDGQWNLCKDLLLMILNQPYATNTQAPLESIKRMYTESTDGEMVRLDGFLKREAIYIKALPDKGKLKEILTEEKNFTRRFDSVVQNLWERHTFVRDPPPYHDRFTLTMETVTEGNVIKDGKVVRDVVPNKREIKLDLSRFKKDPNNPLDDTTRNNILYYLHNMGELSSAIKNNEIPEQMTHLTLDQLKELNKLFLSFHEKIAIAETEITRIPPLHTKATSS